jgi:drug/metabolite transporter (DMT)-like permease
MGSYSDCIPNGETTVPSNRLLSVLILFLLGITWGSGYSIARFATTHGVHPLGYTFWQSLGPAIILILSAYASRHPLSLKSRDIIFYLVCGLIGIAIPNTAMYYAASHLPAGLLALIVNTVPIMIYPIALIAKEEKFKCLRLLSIALAVLGILCLILPETKVSQTLPTQWILFALITPFCFALFATYINPHRPIASTPLSLAAGMLTTSTILLAPLVIATHSFYPITWPLTIPALVILLEIVLSSIGYVLFFWLIKIAGPVYYSLVDGIVGLTGLIWGIFLFNEHFTFWYGLAVILILVAIVMMTWKNYKE